MIQEAQRYRHGYYSCMCRLNCLSRIIYIYVFIRDSCILSPLDVVPNLDRGIVKKLVSKHAKSRQALERLYEYMRLPPLPVNMPDLAGIDLWLLTCPCSWRELAWTFYRCQLPAAVIEVKKIFIEGDKD